MKNEITISEMQTVRDHFSKEFGPDHIKYLKGFDDIGNTVGTGQVLLDWENPLLSCVYRQLVLGEISENEHIEEVSEILDVFKQSIPESNRPAIIKRMAEILSEIKPFAARYLKAREHILDYLTTTIFGDLGLMDNGVFCLQVDLFLLGTITPDALLERWDSKHCVQG